MPFACRRGTQVAVAALVLGSGLAGCHRQPDFDTRYKAAQETISRSAADIDARIDAGASEVARDAPSGTPL